MPAKAILRASADMWVYSPPDMLSSPHCRTVGCYKACDARVCRFVLLRIIVGLPVTVRVTSAVAGILHGLPEFERHLSNS